MDVAGIIDAVFAQGRVLTVPWGIDYFSVIVGALTGALFACDRKLDIIGTVVLGLVTAYGGGIIRDTLLQTEGLYFTSHPDLIVICIVLCVFVFYFRGLFKHLDATVFFADTLSVGLFALAGSSKAFACDQGVVISIILGSITAVGGGAVRDICVGETPGIFKQSNFYAVAGLGGSVAFVALASAGCPLAIAGVVCVATVLLLRYWSVRFGWKTKGEADLTPQVVRGVGSLRERATGATGREGGRVPAARGDDGAPDCRNAEVPSREDGEAPAARGGKDRPARENQRRPRM